MGGLILAACRPQPVQIPITVIVAGTPVVHYVTATPAPATPQPKVLTVCLLEEPESLFPYNNSSPASRAVGEAIWDGPIDSRSFGHQAVTLEKLPSLADGDAVIRRAVVKDGEEIVDARLAVTPLVAGVEYWAYNPSEPATPVRTRYDGQSGSVETIQLAVTFKNRPGLAWSDGQPVTAEDMRLAYHVYTALDPRGRYIAERSAAYDTPDDLTAVWIGKPGYRDALYYTQFFGYWPAHVYGKMAALEQAEDEAARRRPMGWGAFKVAEWLAGEYIRLDRNEHYFRRSEGLPHFDGLIFRFAQDVSQLLARLVGGQCDVGVQDRAWESQAAFLLQAEAQGLLASQFVPGTTLEHLDFNLTPDEAYSGFAAARNPDGTPVFQDVRVRRAFAHCLDRQALTQAVQPGNAQAPPVYVPLAHPFYSAEAIVETPFDSGRGRALLAEAGWTDSDGDGVLDRGGTRMSMNYYTGPAGNTLRERTAELIRDQLRANCGIEINVSILPRPELFAGYNDGGYLFGRKYDLAEFGWLVGPLPACEVYLSRELPTAAYTDGSNNVGYQSAAYDQACEAALTTLDGEAQKRLHQAAMAVFSQDLPSLTLYARLKIAVARPEVQGLALDATIRSELWNVEAMDRAP